jgi:diguanylate cyclase (GGDEF)-like protein
MIRMLNRNFFQDRDFFLHLLELELKRSLRYQSFTSVLLIEIPANRKLHLSKTSTFLERVVASLSSQIRETDIIGTTNENTITVILLNCDKRSTSEVANRVSCWTSQYFGSNSSDGISGSRLGVGAACFPSHATDSEHLLSAASEMLETSRRNSEAQSRVRP